MIISATDIDIDVADRTKVISLFRHVAASSRLNGVVKKHNTGVYFHQIPVDPLTNTCSIDFRQAEEMGYFKLDILNVSIYKDVKDEEHLLRLLDQEPVWSLLEEKDFCDMLFHLKGHDAICKRMKPDSIEKLAAVLAMIRPGKRHLVGEDWGKVMSEVWEKSDDGSYGFKKSHAISYAVAVKVHMNLIIDQLS